MERRSCDSSGCSLFFSCSISLLYIEVWCRLRRVAARTFCRSCCDGRVKACIWRWFASGIVHHGGRRVACLGHVARAGVGVGGSIVYMAQNGGRGAIALISTLCGWSGGRVSKFVTASLADASARSLPRMCVCALIFRRVVE